MNMRNIQFVFFIGLVLISSAGHAQKTEAVLAYIETYKDLAVEEMKRTGVPAAITLAQGIHESGAGKSELVLASNNHFGIKCKSNWTGESVRHDDDAKAECFRKYPRASDSYRDHSDFLKNGQRYSFLFQLDPADYNGWANGLKKAGYATNPKYPQVLIKMIEDYGLQQYTIAGLQPVQNATIPEQQGDSRDADKTPPVMEPANTAPKTIIEERAVAKIYPGGIFKINDLKVVYVKKGTSYLALAAQYGVDLSKLFEYNEITRAEETGSDQLVFLERKRKTGTGEWHVVQAGETPYSIAQQEGIRLESLLEYNKVGKNDQLHTGEKLSLKKRKD